MPRIAACSIDSPRVSRWLTSAQRSHKSSCSGAASRPATADARCIPRESRYRGECSAAIHARASAAFGIDKIGTAPAGISGACGELARAPGERGAPGEPGPPGEIGALGDMPVDSLVANTPAGGWMRRKCAVLGGSA
eukprot:scaffold137695_cov27-Tisochrysis_lutea.AAC.5